jgi:rhodanese-related sulfurtransferase
MNWSSVPEVAVDALPDDAVLLDVREQDEWDAGHASGAVHLPMSELAERLDDVPDASPIFVICRTGSRSARVTQYLEANGWEAVNVSDGMFGWARAGRPMEAVHDQPPVVL